jgi:hypothetical protein
VIKKAVFERQHTYGGKWSNYIDDVVNAYNDAKHSSTRFKPDYLEREVYNFPVQERAWENMRDRAKFPNRRGALEVGDKVKIRLKSGGFGYKETVSSWSREVYTVASVDQEAGEGWSYHLNGYRRPLKRFEMLKIDDVQRPVGGELRSVIHNVQRPTPPRPAEAAAALRANPARRSAPVFRPVTRSSAAAAGGGASGSGLSDAARALVPTLPSAAPAAVAAAAPIAPMAAAPKAAPKPARRPPVIFARNTRSTTRAP